MLLVHLADKEAHVRSEDYGRDLSSVQTLLTKQVKLFSTALSPYLTLPSGWTGSYTCPALRPYQLGPMHVPECNHKVTGSGHKAVDGCEAVDRRL